MMSEDKDRPKTGPRKGGRPRAIPPELEPVLLRLYDQGHGYRAIARILRANHGLNPHYSSVRQTLIRLGKVSSGRTRS
jgi:hypothetical protein